MYNDEREHDSRNENDPPIYKRRFMTDVVNEMTKPFRMSETEQKVRYGMGSAAAAAAIFAPISYKWKGMLTAIAAAAILSATYGVSPARRLMDS
ncbi:MAG: hypothetical protein WAM66_05960 [Acidobacteriaceae bacterium]